MSENLVVAGQRPSAELNELMVGGKGSRLAALCEAGYPVPKFYCLTTAAFATAVSGQRATEFSEHVTQLCAAVNDVESAERAAAVREWIANLPLPLEVESAIRREHASLFVNDVTVAVRSSVAGEDGRSHSFAGMHDTVLNVRGIDAVLAAVKEVWSSAWSDRAIAYRRQRRIPVGEDRKSVV